MSSQKTEIIDLDLDRTFISSKNHEKDLAIEDLNKQLRFQRFESEKRINELENALKLAKSQIDDYEKKLQDSHYIKTIKTLQESLTAVEKELCGQKEREMDYKREIYQLESGMLKLKQQQDNFSKSFRKKLPINPSTARLQPQVTADEKLLEQAEENARQALEKDKQILALKEKLNEVEVYYQTQLSSCMEQIKAMQSKQNAKFSMIGGESEKLRFELLACQDELQREKLIANEQICELTSELKVTVAKYDEMLMRLDQEYADKISVSLKQHIDSTQTKEITLLDEIKKQDEDLDNMRKANKEAEKKLEFLRKQKDAMEAEYQRKIEALEKKDLKTEISKVEKRYQKILQDAQGKFESQLNTKEDIIREYEVSKAQMMKRILHLEGDNKKVMEVNLRLQEKMTQMEKLQTESEEKFAEIIKGYEGKYSELESNYEFEKQTNAYFRNINRGAHYTIGRNIMPCPTDITTPMNNNNLGEINITPTPMGRNNTLSNELKGFTNFLNPARQSFVAAPGSFNFVIEDEPMRDNYSISKRVTIATSARFKAQFSIAESIVSENKIEDRPEEIVKEEKESEDLGDNPHETAKQEKPEKSLQMIEENPDNIEEIIRESIRMQESIRIQDSATYWKQEIEKKDEEIETLRSELKQLREENESLRKKWMAEMENNNSKHAESVKEVQLMRNKNISELLMNNEASNNGESAQVKKANKQKREVEAENYRLRKEFQEEMDFLKEELKKLEERNEETNQKLLKSLNERDYFEQQYKILLEDVRLSKMDQEKEKRNTKEKKVSRWLLCTCK